MCDGDGDAAPVTLRHTASQPGTGQWNILTFAASGDTAVVIRAQEDAVHVLLSSVATHLVLGSLIFLARQAIVWYGTKCSTFPVLSYWAQFGLAFNLVPTNAFSKEAVFPLSSAGLGWAGCVIVVR